MLPQLGETKKREDRRSANRYPVLDTVFITFGPRFDVVGCLIDMSSDGVSFKYTAFEPAERTGLLSVDIHCKPKRLTLDRLDLCLATEMSIVPVTVPVIPFRQSSRLEAASFKSASLKMLYRSKTDSFL